MNTEEKTRQVMEKLDRLGIKATVDGNGDISLPMASRETGNNICLPPEEMASLIDRASEVGLRCLWHGVFQNIIVSIFNMDYAANRK